MSAATAGGHYQERLLAEPRAMIEGLGKMIMDAIMSWLTVNAPPTAFVSLIADEGLSGFYERYGFRVRLPEAPGMSFTVR